MGPLRVLGATCIIALDKDGASIRPLQITSAVRRLACNVVCKMEIHSAMESLFGGQHGLAITAGAELMHKSVVMMLQRFDDFGVAAADVSTAERCGSRLEN